MLRDGLVFWSGLVSFAAFAAWADLGVYGPGGWVTVAIAVVATQAFWVFAFAVLAAIHRDARRTEG